MCDKEQLIRNAPTPSEDDGEYCAVVILDVEYPAAAAGIADSSTPIPFEPCPTDGTAVVVDGASVTDVVDGATVTDGTAVVVDGASVTDTAVVDGASVTDTAVVDGASITDTAVVDGTAVVVGDASTGGADGCFDPAGLHQAFWLTPVRRITFIPKLQ